MRQRTRLILAHFILSKDLGKSIFIKYKILLSSWSITHEKLDLMHFTLDRTIY